MVTDEMIDAAIRANTNAKLFGGEPRDWVRKAAEKIREEGKLPWQFGIHGH
jgi:hypothetical protein